MKGLEKVRGAKTYEGNDGTSDGSCLKLRLFGMGRLGSRKVEGVVKSKLLQYP